MKQTKEHINKRVQTRIKNGSYTNNKGNYGATKGKHQSIKTEFKKGHPTWNKGIKKQIDIDLIKKMYLDEEKSTYDIGKEFNVNQKTIENRLKENGIKIRIRGGYTKLQKEKIKESRKYQENTYTSSIEIKIQSFLKELNIEFISHKYILMEHSYQADIFIPSLNLVIECDGNYWHNYPYGNDIDKLRTKELKELGFKVIRLWETEINKMDINNFKEILESI